MAPGRRAPGRKGPETPGGTGSRSSSAEGLGPTPYEPGMARPPPPKGESWILEPIPLPPTRSQPPPDRGSVRLPGAADGVGLGSRGGARARHSPVSGPRQVWRSWKERVAARSSGSRRSSTSHRAFWKVPPGAPQPSSFVAEPRRVTRRKSRPSRRCHRPAVTRATARGSSGWRGLCRTALWGWVPSAPGTFWSPFFPRYHQSVNLDLQSAKQPGKHNAIQGNSVRRDEELRKNVAHRECPEAHAAWKRPQG
ncbi:uncharacterized protein LOC111827910 [Myotis lucifugus]|uniref:uncharacterized protein LOC111827910 n=1 Tax=Myotis lucifugus TaxID=59463 RepID=UPI000CCBEF9A|nr:uncharacterized protein LOC111827910 [Myotis lucifugus]